MEENRFPDQTPEYTLQNASTLNEISEEIFSAIMTATMMKHSEETALKAALPECKISVETVEPPKVKQINPPQEHTLGVVGLHKKFGKKEVVKGVTFTMKNGEVA